MAIKETAVKSKQKNEVQERMAAQEVDVADEVPAGPETVLEKFQREAAEREKKALEPKAADREVVSNMTKDQLEKFQEERRLVGYDPKTRQGIILSKDFAAKKETARIALEEKKAKAAKTKNLK